MDVVCCPAIVSSPQIPPFCGEHGIVAYLSPGGRTGFRKAATEATARSAALGIVYPAQPQHDPLSQSFATIIFSHPRRCLIPACCVE